MAGNSHSESVIKYNRKQDNIMIRPSKEEGARIRNAAKLSGCPSVQAYILETLRARMDADGIPSDVVSESAE